MLNGLLDIGNLGLEALGQLKRDLCDERLVLHRLRIENGQPTNSYILLSSTSYLAGFHYPTERVNDAT